jgi:hypothetical protein
LRRLTGQKNVDPNVLLFVSHHTSPGLSWTVADNKRG